MTKRKSTDSIRIIRKSIFVCVGVLFFFCFLGCEKSYAGVTAEWKSGSDVANLEEWKFEVYQTEDGKYANLTEYVGTEKEEIVIPGNVTDEEGNVYPVGRIAGIAGGQSLVGVKKIDISENIKRVTLKKHCFTGLLSLEEIEIACQLQIEEEAFYGCGKLTSLQCKKGFEAFGTSMETFAGCTDLEEIVVSGGKIQIKGGVFDSIPGVVSLVLEDTIELQFCDDFSRGNVNLLCNKNLTSQEPVNMVVKNGYFYDPLASIENMNILPKEKIYAITTSPVYRMHEEICTDVVAEIEIGKVRNTAFYVEAGKKRNLTVRDLKMITDEKEDCIKVRCHTPLGMKTIYIDQWQENTETPDYSQGAVFYCKPFEAGEVQNPVIQYSGKRYILNNIQGHNSQPAGVDIQVREGTSLVEGMKAEILSKCLLVTVLFEDRSYKELLSEQDYKVFFGDGDELKFGQENQIFVFVKKEYKITGELFYKNVEKKKVVSGTAIYTKGTAYEGTKPDEKDFSILAVYNNGETAYLPSPSVTFSAEKIELGEHEYAILCEGCQMFVKIIGVPDLVREISVSYQEPWVLEGESLKTEKISFELIRESGKQERVQSYLPEPYSLQEGENIIHLSYTGNLTFVADCDKTAELMVLCARKEDITTGISLKDETLRFLPESVIDVGFLEVRQTYQGKTAIIDNPELIILPYELQAGENVLQVKYQEGLYPVTVRVEEAKPEVSREPVTGPAVEPTKIPSTEPIKVPTIEPMKTPATKPSQTSTPKPVFHGKISVAGTGKIKFESNKKKSYSVYVKEPVSLVFRTEKIKKIQWQFVRAGKNYKKTAWKTLKGNVWKYHKNITNRVLYIQITDENGNRQIKKTNPFTIDRKKPVLNIENQKKYPRGTAIRAADKESGIKKITLNGKKVSNGKKLTKKGSYQIIVWDKAGNCTKRKFFIV